MLKVEKWAQDKNPAIAFLAISLALAAREKSAALRNIKERRLYSYHFELPDLPSWFSMYQSRKPIYAYKRLTSSIPYFSKNMINFFIGFKFVNRMFKRYPLLFENMALSQQEIEEGLEYWRGLCAETFEDIKQEIEKTQPAPEIKAKFHEIMTIGELPLGFYFLVHSPCLLFYETSPAKLYRKAQDRDVLAIEMLLKLDPLILHDPAIGYQIQSVRLYGKQSDYDRIFAAISKEPRINYKRLSDERRSIKSDHGAQIYVLARKCNNPLDTPQIRGLYDALAQDLDGTLIDTDIKKLEGFDKTIRTKAVTWQKRLQISEKQK